MKLLKEKILEQLDLRRKLMEMRHSPDNSGYPLTRRQVEKMLSQYERRGDEDGWNDSPEYRSVDGWKKARWYPPELESNYVPDANYNSNPDQRPAKLMPYDYDFNVYKLDDVDKLNHKDIDDDDDKKNFVKDYDWKGETNIYEDAITKDAFKQDDYTDGFQHDKYVKLRGELSPKNLDKKSEDAIESYSYYSKKLNKNLFNKAAGHDYVHSYVSQADDINDAIDKFPKPVRSFYAYHGVKKKTIGELKEGNEISHAGFISASLSPRVAEKFVDYDENGNGHLLRIHVKKGTHNGAYIEKLSQSPEEREFLIKHGSKLNILKKAEVVTHGDKKIQVWDAEVK